MVWVASLLTWAILAVSPAFAIGQADVADPFGRRLALVIGNSEYNSSIESLKNAINDAELIAASLKKVGFRVTLLENADRKQFQAALDKLEQEAKSADAVLVYYSGHGFQLGGSNYLVPTDAVLTSRDVIKERTIELDDIIRQLASPDRPTLIMLDACRNNPLPASVRGRESEGLAQITRMVNTFVTFSTQPGNVSVDGKGNNGPFAAALAQNLDQPGKSISDVMINVRKAVLTATSQIQNPWEQANLTDQFYFNPEVADSVISFGPVAAPARPEPQPGNLAIERPTPLTAERPIEVATASPVGVTPGVATAVETTPMSVVGAGSATSPTLDTVVATPQQQPPTRPADKVIEVAELPPNQAMRDIPSIGSVSTLNSPSIVGIDVTPEDVVVGKPVEPDLPEDLDMAVQTELKRLGCYTGAIDGKWGGGSADAMEAFYRGKRESIGDTDATPAVYTRLKGESGTVCAVVANVEEPKKVPERPVAKPQARPAADRPEPPAKRPEVKKAETPPARRPAPAPEPPSSGPKINTNKLGGAGMFR